LGQFFGAVDSFVYVTDYAGQVRLIDMADLTHPIEVDRQPLSSRFMGMVTSGDYIYLATEYEGILVLRRPSRP
jgi:hypothetical protein